ncbi:MAG: DUF4340 domain-containing protein [bacterium]
MSWKPTLWILILVVVTALFILVFDRPADSPARALPIEAPLLPLSPGAVTRLAITAGDVVIECVRREGEWVLTRPEEARADEARIKQILEALDASRIRETLSPERLVQRRLTAASFGLDAPRARLVVGTELRADEILVGDDAPLGDLVYLRLKNGTDVIGATLKMSDILPINFEGMRDHFIFPPSLKRVTRLELKHSGGFLQLALRDGQWRIQQPIDARADNRRVEQLIQSLMALKVEAFGAVAAPSDPAVYGLTADEGLMQITLTPEGGRAPLVLTVGKARQDLPDLIYARISDVSSLCSINREVLAFQAIKAESLRDRRLCNADPAAIVSIMLREGDEKLVLEKQEKTGWMIREPFRFKADSQAVGGLLRAICNLKIAESSGNGTTLAPGGTPPTPACRLALATELPSSLVTNTPPPLTPPKGTSWSYRFAVPVAAGANNQVYCEETKMVTEVQPRELSAVWPGAQPSRSLSDPRPYMDCRMFEFPSDQVRRVTLAQNGREETVSVGSDGLWLADSPPEGQIRKGAIPELLSLASSLRAERIESMNATNLLAYGIDESSPRVTFGLTGASGIQKTVLIGGPCGTNGVYSMIQGQDVVFVLKQEMAQALSRPLVEMR